MAHSSHRTDSGRKPLVHRDEWRLLIGLLIIAGVAALVLQWLSW